jgi:hypothetical protein
MTGCLFHSSKLTAVGPPDEFRSGWGHGWNGQPINFHTGGCWPAARSLTVRGQAVINCHLDTRPPDASYPDPCMPSPSSFRQYDQSSARKSNQGCISSFGQPLETSSDSPAKPTSKRLARAPHEECSWDGCCRVVGSPPPLYDTSKVPQYFSFEVRGGEKLV